MSRTYLILTDLGGLQEESPSLDKPMPVLRETTECPAVLTLGAAKRVGVGRETIARETVRLLEDPSARMKMASVTNPDGDGHAGQCIAQGIRAYSDGLPEER